MYFDQDSYGNDSPIVKELVPKWYEIPKFQQLRNFEIKKTELTREDNLFFALAGITSKTEEFITVEDSGHV